MFNMEDQVIKGRSLKSLPPKQKKRMILPDVMLHTRDVMIPIARPVPLNQSVNVLYSENRPQILKMQYYKNNPALTFPESPLHTLYNPLENLFEVKRIDRWKYKNQNKKYTISGKTGSLCGSKQRSISQNFCPSRRFSCNRKDNTLHFPNTMLVNFESPANNKNLREASLKSIKLSRKCDVLQIKENEIQHKNELAITPKETLNNTITNQPVVSLSSQSSHDVTDSVFTLSTLSVSSLQIEKKKTFANIGNRRNSMPRITSKHLHPSNSEYELSVLHYENDSPADNALDANKAVPDFKYSWELDNWIPYSRKKGHNNVYEAEDVELYRRKPYDCKIKYSWQVIGMSAQTSDSLLQDLLYNSHTDDKAYKTCDIKYSWQIIGISTQTNLRDYKNSDYWKGMVVTANKNYNENKIARNNDADRERLRDHARYPERKLKKYLILYNQQTQTFAEKTTQTDINDINDVNNHRVAKYSWHNLLKQYL